MVSLGKIDRSTETIESQLKALTSSIATVTHGIKPHLTSTPHTIESNTAKVLNAIAEHVSGPTSRLLQNQDDQIQFNQQNMIALSNITKQLEDIKLLAEAPNRFSSEPSKVCNLIRTQVESY
jgi:oligoendopeptidase F